jgi:hypothetical protein
MQMSEIACFYVQLALALQKLGPNVTAKKASAIICFLNNRFAF